MHAAQPCTMMEPPCTRGIRLAKTSNQGTALLFSALRLDRETVLRVPIEVPMPMVSP